VLAERQSLVGTIIPAAAAEYAVIMRQCYYTSIGYIRVSQSIGRRNHVHIPERNAKATAAAATGLHAGYTSDFWIW